MNRPLLTACAALLLGTAGCGSIASHRNMLSYHYFDNVASEMDEATCLVTWPFHLVVLTGLYVVDQTIYTVVCIEPAGRDSIDYLKIKGNGNNVMLEHTIAAPKIVATPVIFVGSWLTRWVFPFEKSDRPFGE